MANARQTGSGGFVDKATGQRVPLNEKDQRVLDIIGRDSPLLNGMSIEESYGDQANEEAAYAVAHSEVVAEERVYIEVSISFHY